MNDTDLAEYQVDGAQGEGERIPPNSEHQVHLQI